MRDRWHYRFRRTTLQLVLFVAFLCGIGLARAGYVIADAWLWLAGATLILCFRGRTIVTLLLVVLFGLSLGLWRGTLFMQKLAMYEALNYQKITITARATDDAVYGKNSQLSFDAAHVHLENGTELAGKVSLAGFGANGIFQGDEVRATGKLYSGYGAYQGQMSFAQIHILEHHQSLVAELRRKFAAGMQSALPEPLASFAMGLLVGQRATLPPEVKQDLLMVGLTHIIAVSGYNLTIMLHASKRLFGKRSKRITIFLSIALIGVFLLLAGSSASIVRAAIVSMLSIWASYYGRSFKPLNLIALAAAITAWVSPFYVWSDISWYLSFLAFYGVMVLAPLVQARWPAGWRESLVASVALESICAEAMTLPFVLRMFGQMSFIGLPANVLVVTLVPLAMLLSLVAGLVGMLAGPVSGWFAWPARLLLTYMLDLAHTMAGLPHVFVEHISLSLSWMIGLYIVALITTRLLWRRTKTRKYAKITETHETSLQGVGG